MGPTLFRLWSQKGGELLGTFTTPGDYQAAMTRHAGGQLMGFYIEVERDCSACGARCLEDPIVGPDVPVFCPACNP